MGKNILRKVFVLAVGLFLLIPVYKVGAAEVVSAKSTKMRVKRGGVDISVRLQTGYLTGEAHEYVYWPEYDHTASELIWKIDSIEMQGAGISVRPLRWLVINYEHWFNIDKGSGTMDDYDWLVRGMDDWTDWSHHENTDVAKGTIQDINVEMTPFRVGPLSFSGLVGYKRENWEWKAYGGSYIYSGYGFRDDKGKWPDKELGISYEQTFNVPYIGISVNGDFGGFNVKTRLIGSPFVNGEAVDNHHQRNLVTYDDFSNGSLIIHDIAGAYSFTEHLALQMALSYTKYGTMKGDSCWYYNDTGTVKNLEDFAGADLETIMLSFSFVVSI